MRFCRPAAEQGWQTARAIEVSTFGARLGSLMTELHCGEVIEIQSGTRRAPFQVVWMTTSHTPAGWQAGLECLTPEVNIWDLHPFSETEKEAAPAEVELARTVQRRLLPQEFRR